MTNERRPSPTAVSSWVATLQSALNGCVGDYLHASDNGLGIELALYAHGHPLPLTREALLQVYPHPTAKLCLLVHGLGCHEGIWAYDDPDCPGHATSYGDALHADLGYTPLYVRYNTGLSIAANGQRLAHLLEALIACYPLPVAEIVLIGHSMGGLVIRHACFAGNNTHAAWARHVTRVFYLGSPHEGATLAMLGHVATGVLHAVPNPITRLIGDIFNLRSQGVKDLYTAPQVDGHDHDHSRGPSPRTLPWLNHARHYLIAGMLTEDPAHLVTTLLGDGLVRLPRAKEPVLNGTPPPPIPPEHVACFPRTDHLQLAHDPAVYKQIRAWCAGPERSF